MKKAIQSAIARSIAAASGLEATALEPLLERPKNAEFGDLAFPCFMLAKSWKLAPAACAEKLARELALPPSVESVTPTGPFLNFRFARGPFIAGAVRDALRKSFLERAGAPEIAREKIVLEYSSPNIAKPFHVGHLRATLLGNSLDRIYRRLQYPTVTVNHLGDWGTQFGFVWAGCELWGKPESPSVKTLVELYKKATSLKEQQEKGTVQPEWQSLPDVNSMARGFFLDLEEGKGYAVEFWKWCSEISLRYLRATYDRLGVHFDHYTGESFYSDKLDGVRKELEDAGLLKESDGAFGVDLGEKLGFARILTPDGRSLYLTRDLATAEYRAATFHFTKALYVVGTPQTLHFQQIKGVLAALGHEYAERIEHVAFGHVMGMKTRGGGEIVELNEFLDEAYERALAAYREQVSKRPEGLDESTVAEAVALAAIIFSNLARSRLKDVHFSWEHALAFQGDSGPYLLYAHARMNGIRERAQENGIVADASKLESLVQEESAFLLAAALAELPEILRKTIEENEPAYLASFALEVAKAFSKAYNELKVVGEESSLAGARLALFEATREVLAESISLLGMKVIDRM